MFLVDYNFSNVINIISFTIFQTWNNVLINYKHKQNSTKIVEKIIDYNKDIIISQTLKFIVNEIFNNWLIEKSKNKRYNKNYIKSYTKIFNWS